MAIEGEDTINDQLNVEEVIARRYLARLRSTERLHGTKLLHSTTGSISRLRLE